MGNVISNVSHPQFDLGSGVRGGIAPTAINRTRIASPEFIFTDDFEGVEDGTFWGSGTRTAYGVTATQDVGYAGGKVMSMDYQAAVVDADSSSEKRFVFPDCVQLEMAYKFYTPLNFIHRAPGNNKLFALWSGAYGVTPSNISILSEYNKSTVGQAGSHPDLYLGEDGNNYGHSSYFDQSGDRIFLEGDGAWHDMHVYVELAGQEGEFGKVEIWLDDKLIISNEWLLDIQSDAGGIPSSQHIAYSTRGNFLNQGYLFGWANSGFSDATTFYVDDFSLKTRTSSIGATY